MLKSSGSPVTNSKKKSNKLDSPLSISIRNYLKVQLTPEPTKTVHIRWRFERAIALFKLWIKMKKEQDNGALPDNFPPLTFMHIAEAYFVKPTFYKWYLPLLEMGRSSIARAYFRATKDSEERDHEYVWGQYKKGEDYTDRDVKNAKETLLARLSKTEDIVDWQELEPAALGLAEDGTWLTPGSSSDTSTVPSTPSPSKGPVKASSAASGSKKSGPSAGSNKKGPVKKPLRK